MITKHFIFACDHKINKQHNSSHVRKHMHTRWWGWTILCSTWNKQTPPCCCIITPQYIIMIVLLQLWYEHFWWISMTLLKFQMTAKCVSTLTNTVTTLLIFWCKFVSYLVRYQCMRLIQDSPLKCTQPYSGTGGGLAVDRGVHSAFL